MSFKSTTQHTAFHRTTLFFSVALLRDLAMQWLLPLLCMFFQVARGGVEQSE